MVNFVGVHNFSIEKVCSPQIYSSKVFSDILHSYLNWWSATADKFSPECHDLSTIYFACNCQSPKTPKPTVLLCSDMVIVRWILVWTPIYRRFLFYECNIVDLVTFSIRMMNWRYYLKHHLLYCTTC